MNGIPKLSRRGFLKTIAKGAAGGVAGGLLLSAGRADGAWVGANDRIRLGIIGCGNMGRAHMYSLAYRDDCELVAICDVFKPRYEEVAPNIETITGKKPATYQDYRYVLDRNDVDAIFVVTPDHWHPLITIHGCEAGKDVYVEKPASPTVAEGRAMVDAARRYGRVVQVGTQQRSMPVFQKAIQIIHDGRLGPITAATAWIGPNHHTNIETPEEVPEGLDWDMWLGPSPWVPFSWQRFGGHMSWHDYCRGGELSNWGVHLIDILHWGIQQDRALSVQAVGHSHQGQAGADNYQNIDVFYEYEGCTLTWEQRHHNFHNNRGGGQKFQGTQGQLFVDRGSYEVMPEGLGIERYVGEPERTWANADHHQNFFDCIRSRRRPRTDIEIGHRSTTAVNIGGIALKVGRKLYWDGETETFLRDDEANRHLSRPYRAPWHF